MNELLLRTLELVYFMAPAYFANMAPPFLKYWKGWNKPISKKLLGSHKTVLGFFIGIIAAVIITFAQSNITWQGSIVDYSGWLVLGLLFGVGAMAGDSLKSVFKRKAGIKPGRPWIPFDQVDFIIGALILVWPMVALSFADVGIILLLTFAGHILINHIGFWLGVRNVKW